MPTASSAPPCSAAPIAWTARRTATGFGATSCARSSVAQSAAALRRPSRSGEPSRTNPRDMVEGALQPLGSRQLQKSGFFEEAISSLFIGVGPTFDMKSRFYALLGATEEFGRSEG